MNRGAGSAKTAGGSVIPMVDLIRVASRAIHYLAVFDEHTNQPLYLGRARRLASVGQRLVLLARDGGCTFPGCTVGGYGTQVHHMIGWAKRTVRPTSRTCPSPVAATTGWPNSAGPSRCATGKSNGDPPAGHRHRANSCQLLPPPPTPLDESRRRARAAGRRHRRIGLGQWSSRLNPTCGNRAVAEDRRRINLANWESRVPRDRLPLAHTLQAVKAKFVSLQSGRIQSPHLDPPEVLGQQTGSRAVIERS